jgi:fibronectin-binding autotransporter adhesin
VPLRSTRRFALILFAFVAASLSAQSVWIGGGVDNNWTTPQNWAGGIPPVPGSTTWLDFRDSSYLNPNADTLSPWVVNHIDFESRVYVGAVSFSVSGNPLSFQGTSPQIVSYAQAPELISNDIEIPDGPLTIDSFLSWPITLAGRITGKGGVVIVGSVSFTAPNNYEGVTQIGRDVEGGNLLITDSMGLGNSPQVVGWLSLSGGIRVRGKTLTGELENRSGNNVWDGDLDFGFGGTISSSQSGQSITVNGTIDCHGNALSVRGSGDVVLAGTVRNATTWGIYKWGVGKLTLSGTGSNIYEIDLPDGMLDLASRNALPKETWIQMNPNTGNVYDLAYPTLKIEQDTTIGGLRCYSSGQNSGGFSTVQLGPHTLTINQSFYTNFAGTITGGGGVIKAGAGTLELDASNSYSGGTLVIGGALMFASPESIGGAGPNVTVSNGSVIATRYYPIDQAFLNRINPSSDGVVAACNASSNNDLDFAAAGLTNMSFGALGPVTYGGAITPANSVYRFGSTGVVSNGGGTLTLIKANALSGDASLELGPTSTADAVILVNDNTITGSVTVKGGLLQINQATLGSGPVEIMGSATLDLKKATLNTSTVTVDQAGVLSGCGTINGNLVNNGTVTVASGCGPLQVNGGITNNGTMFVYSGSTLVAGGPFVNNGVLDILGSPQTVLPSGFVNNGTVIDSTSVAAQKISKTGNIVSITLASFSGHSYQLQRSPSLEPAKINWQNVGNAQWGNTGRTLTLTDPNAGGPQMFYRVQILP